MALKHKDLISIHDLEIGEVALILDVAAKLKRKQKKGEPHQYLKGKTLAMLFSKASTRTRTSFEVGFFQLGGHPIYLSDQMSPVNLKFLRSSRNSPSKQFLPLRYSISSSVKWSPFIYSTTCSSPAAIAYPPPSGFLR